MATLSLVPQSAPPAKSSWETSAARPESPIGFAELWRALCHGDVVCVDTRADETHFYATFERRELVRAQRQSARTLEVLERVLLGDLHKLVSLDLHLAASSVSAMVKSGLEAMGFHSLRTPPIAAMAVHAAHGHEIAADVVRLPGKPHLFSVSVRRPDINVRPRLSEAERDVLRLLLDGESYDVMARQRRTSRRTVANQIASIYRTLGVSGRTSLFAALIRYSPPGPDTRAQVAPADAAEESPSGMPDSIERRLARVEEQLGQLSAPEAEFGQRLSRMEGMLEAVLASLAGRGGAA